MTETIDWALVDKLLEAAGGASLDLAEHDFPTMNASALLLTALVGPLEVAEGEAAQAWTAACLGRIATERAVNDDWEAEKCCAGSVSRLWPCPRPTGRSWCGASTPPWRGSRACCPARRRDPRRPRHAAPLRQSALLQSAARRLSSRGRGA